MKTVKVQLWDRVIEMVDYEPSTTCPRCNGTAFDEIDCGPGSYDDDITWMADRCKQCGLWYSSWKDKWLIDVYSWKDEQDAEEFKPSSA